MFARADEFEGNLSQWQVSNGAHYAGMFAGASTFNSDLSNWNVSAAVSFQYMFKSAAAFNQNLCQWESKVHIGILVDGDIVRHRHDLLSKSQTPWKDQKL